jgi:hypothetical protein
MKRHLEPEDLMHLVQHPEPDGKLMVSIAVTTDPIHWRIVWPAFNQQNVHTGYKVIEVVHSSPTDPEFKYRFSIR